MKDKQIQAHPPQPGIPLLSPILHCLAMPAIIFLRSSFGYAFLRPKSVFLSFTWAFCLFSIYAWYEPGVWPEWRAACLFGLSTAALYILHLFVAFGREIKRSGRHDYFSGKSHFLRILPALSTDQKSRIESFVHLWLEPGIVFFVSLVCRFSDSPKLAAFLQWGAAALWCKEAINYWYLLRHQKKHSDVFSDAEDSLESYPGQTSAPPSMPKAANLASGAAGPARQTQHRLPMKSALLKSSGSCLPTRRSRRNSIFAR